MPDENHSTKIAILQAAVGFFSRKGYNGTTTKEIALEAGFAEGTIFRHFPSKLDILYGVVENFMPLIGVETLKKSILECRDMDSEQALEHIISNRLEVIGEGKDIMRIILTETQYDLELRKIYIERVYKPISQMLSEFFEQRMKRGEYREMNPKILATMVFSAILFAVGNQHYFGNEDEHDSLEANELTDVLLNGIRRGKGDA